MAEAKKLSDRIAALDLSSKIESRWKRRTKANSAQFLLSELPADLLLLVVDCLDWQSIKSLRLTCKGFSQAIKLPQLRLQHMRCQNETAALEEQVILLIKATRTGGRKSAWVTSKRLPRNLEDKVPCYRCLRWLQRKKMDTSEFSYGMAHQSPEWQNQSSKCQQRLRFCFTCGVKNGVFVKGSRWKGHIICRRCGQLGRKQSGRTYYTTPEGRRSHKYEDYRYQRYCETCVDSGKIPQTFAEYVHQKAEFCKYEKTMYRKWEETKAKRRALGVPVGDEGNKWQVWCPVLKREAICNCWNNPSQCDTLRSTTFEW